MAFRRILKYPEDEPILREVSSAVTDFGQPLQTLLADLFETAKYASGIGLAAPQIGVLKRVFVVCLPDCGKKEFVNPVLANLSSDAIEIDEGCLSFPGKFVSVKRAKSLRVYALDRFGNPFEMEAKDLFAVCLQHETDHLNGVLFID